MEFSYLDRNVKKIKNEINQNINTSGREPCDVLLMAATKSASADEINYIHKNLGIHDIGENRVQQLLEKWEHIDHDGLNVHFIGTLQTNKVKYIIDKVCLIHSLDSEKLAREIDKQAKKHGIIMNVLLEVNSGREENKSGVFPEHVLEFAQELRKYENIKQIGFMTMAPICENVLDYNKYFAKTRDLCVDIWYNEMSEVKAPVLSMGMSGSFGQAIQEGSTIVRVGSCIFSPKD